MTEADDSDKAGKRPGPENKEAADQATRDNDLSTGHSDPDDGGADNAKPENKHDPE